MGEAGRWDGDALHRTQDIDELQVDEADAVLG